MYITEDITFNQEDGGKIHLKDNEEFDREAVLCMCVHVMFSGGKTAGGMRLSTGLTSGDRRLGTR